MKVIFILLLTFSCQRERYVTMHFLVHSHDQAPLEDAEVYLNGSILCRTSKFGICSVENKLRTNEVYSISVHKLDSKEYFSQSLRKMTLTENDDSTQRLEFTLFNTPKTESADVSEDMDFGKQNKTIMSKEVKMVSQEMIYSDEKPADSNRKKAAFVAFSAQKPLAGVIFSEWNPHEENEICTTGASGYCEGFADQKASIRGRKDGFKTLTRSLEKTSDEWSQISRWTFFRGRNLKVSIKRGYYHDVSDASLLSLWIEGNQVGKIEGTGDIEVPLEENVSEISIRNDSENINLPISSGKSNVDIKLNFASQNSLPVKILHNLVSLSEETSSDKLQAKFKSLEKNPVKENYALTLNAKIKDTKESGTVRYSVELTLVDSVETLMTVEYPLSFTQDIVGFERAVRKFYLDFDQNFPVEGVILENKEKLISVNLGSESVPPIQLGDTLEIFPVQFSAEDTVHTLGKIISVKNQQSEVLITQTGPRATIVPGLKVRRTAKSEGIYGSLRLPKSVGSF